MNVFIGRWKIIEMEQWDEEYINFVEPGYIRFDKEDLGEFMFGVVRGFLDCRYSDTGGSEKVDFSWEGDDEGAPVCGRGWAEMDGTDEIRGMLYFHLGDESWFKAVREQAVDGDG